MAAGAFVFPEKAKLNMLNGATGLLNASGTYKMALVASTWTPDDSSTGNEVWADASANEISAVNGYTAGGVTLTGVSLAMSGSNIKFTSNAASWTASGGNIPAWRYGVVYYSGTLNAKVNPIVGHFLGDSTPADVPATSSGNTLTVTPNASGILSAT